MFNITEIQGILQQVEQLNEISPDHATTSDYFGESHEIIQECIDDIQSDIQDFGEQEDDANWISSYAILASMTLRYGTEVMESIGAYFDGQLCRTELICELNDIS